MFEGHEANVKNGVWQRAVVVAGSVVIKLSYIFFLIQMASGLCPPIGKGWGGPGVQRAWVLQMFGRRRD